LRLIAGGRYTTDRLSLDRYSYNPVFAADPVQNEVLDVDNFSWKLGAQYDLMRNTMVYGTASRGFKGGQIATPSATVSSPSLPYVVLPEIPTAYEVGLKSTLFGSWVADLSIFYQKIKNFQAQQCTVDTGSISCVQKNIDGVKSRGAEINFFGKVFEGLSLNTGFIYAKATYPTGYVGTDGTVIGGTQLAYAPKYKFTLSGEYEVPVTNRFNGFVAVDTVWKSRVRYEANSNSETTFRPHWLVGGRIGVRTDDDRYSLSIFGRNLFNVHEPSLMQSAFPYTTDSGEQNIGAIYGPQSFRQVGLSFDAKF
jgi:iron complex outermembrane receptor protein